MNFANVARCQAFVARVLALSSGDRASVSSAGVAAQACPIDPTYGWPSVANCTAAGNINSAWEQAYRTYNPLPEFRNFPFLVIVASPTQSADDRAQLNPFFTSDPFFFRLAAGAAYATLVYETDPTTYTTLYGPFEGVIPFASL